MKNDKQNTILMGVTSVCVVVSLIVAGFVLRFNRNIRTAQEIQIQAGNVQRQQIERNMLFNDLREYAKTHPDLQPILNQPVPAPKPAAK